MSSTVFAVLSGLVLLVVMQRWRGATIHSEVLRARKSQDTKMLIEMLVQKKSAGQPSAFNRAIRQLWDLYERELAAALVQELAVRHPNERITQYWLDLVKKVEPEVMKKMFRDGFFQSYYRPEVAAKCGNVG